MKTLLEILSMKRPHTGANELKVATEILTRLPYEVRVFEDIQGYPMAYLVEVGAQNLATLFVAHLDTCHNNETTLNPIVYDSVKQEIFKEDGECLGADDGAGLWLLYKMIEANIPGAYLFTVGEEHGGVGARWIADNAKEFLSKFHRAIEFDRAGTSSVITHQGWCNRCCSDEFAIELSNRLSSTSIPLYFTPDDTGIYTDTAEFTELIPECTNISVGYYNQHSGKETLDIMFLQNLLKVCIAVDWESLPTIRNPKLIRDATYQDHLCRELLEELQDLSLQETIDALNDNLYDIAVLLRYKLDKSDKLKECSMSYIPDDSRYYDEPEEDHVWQTCCCEACEDKRADYGDYMYEQRKDEELERSVGI